LVQKMARPVKQHKQGLLKKHYWKIVPTQLVGSHFGKVKVECDHKCILGKMSKKNFRLRPNGNYLLGKLLELNGEYWGVRKFFTILKRRSFKALEFSNKY
jgi:hypothetical protein